MTATLNPACPGANAALALLQRLEDGGWTRLGVPGFDAALTRSQLGETYDLVCAFLLGEDHHFDAAQAAKQLLAWLQTHRPWRTTALLAVVFGSAHVLDIERITPVGEAGWYHRVAAGVVDLSTSTFYGFTGYGWLVEQCGLKPGRH
jgi:hypothetical protein